MHSGGMSVTPDAPKEQAALKMGQRLDEVLAHDRTGTNALNFLLQEHTPRTPVGRREWQQHSNLLTTHASSH